LGEEDGSWAAAQFDVTAAGTFEHGSSVLQRLLEPDDPERYERVRSRLLAVRDARPQPARDDKVVAAWNGLAIAALAEAGVLFDRPDHVAAAQACAALLREVHTVDGRLLRTSRDGRAGRNAGVLEDYADVAEGLLALFSATGEDVHLHQAQALLEVVLARFGDGAGGLFDTADDAQQLIRRPQDPTDNATPSGLAAAAGALLTCAAVTGEQRFRGAAEATVATVAPLIARHARFAGWAAAVGEALLAGPAEVVVLARPDLLAAARLATSPGAVVVTGGPLAAGRAPGSAYVCRGFVCELPTTSVPVLHDQLQVAQAHR